MDDTVKKNIREYMNRAEDFETSLFALESGYELVCQNIKEKTGDLSLLKRFENYHESMLAKRSVKKIAENMGKDLLSSLEES